MKDKVKIELPSKYAIGVKVMMPIVDAETVDLCKQFLSAVSCSLKHDGEIDMNNILEHGRELVSMPMLRSIAEIKVEGLNGAFRHFKLPFEAFIEKEEGK